MKKYPKNVPLTREAVWPLNTKHLHNATQNKTTMRMGPDCFATRGLNGPVIMTLIWNGAGNDKHTALGSRQSTINKIQWSLEGLRHIFYFMCIKKCNRYEVTPFYHHICNLRKLQIWIFSTNQNMYVCVLFRVKKKQ